MLDIKVNSKGIVTSVVDRTVKMLDELMDSSEFGYCDICGYWVDELPVHNWYEH